MKTVSCLVLSALLLQTTSLAEPTLVEAAQQQVEKLRATSGLPRDYSEQAEKLSQIFLEYPIAHFVIEGTSDASKKKTTKSIFIRGEEVYISASEGWNLVANESGVFEWETGKKSGIKIKRDNGDLLAYVNYLTDPSGILSALYEAYRKTPEKFKTVENREKGWSELLLVPPVYNFEAVYFTKNPFWLHGLRTKNEEGTIGEITLSKPKQVQAVSGDIVRQFRDITFEDSDLSLKRHLTFL